MKQQWYQNKGPGLLRRMPYTNWHDWFAWRPVYLTDGPNRGKLVWWKTIKRMIKCRSYDNDDYYYRSK